MINIAYSTVMLFNAAIAIYQAVAVWLNKSRSFKSRLLTSLVSVGSFIWSLGFGILFLMDNPGSAWACRVLGLIGVFLFLSCMVLLIGEFSSFPGKLKLGFYIMGFGGFILWPFISQRSQMQFTFKDDGWISYSMANTGVNTVYSIYCILISIIFLIMIINIIRSSTRRTHILGLQLLGVVIVMSLGMVLDTLLPMFGFDAFPGSSITQFWGLAVVLLAYVGVDKSQVTISNMSNYVYSCVSVPVIIYDSAYKPVIVNDAAFDFLGRTREETPISDFDTYTLFGLYGNELADSRGERISCSAACLANGVMCSIVFDTITDRYGDVIGYILNVNDITEQMDAMNKLEMAMAIAEESNHSKSVFLANVSHELRTPMNSIIGFSELLMSSELKPEDKDYVNDILTSSRCLLDIINDVLDITKIEAGSVEIVETDIAPGEIFKQPVTQTETLIAEKDIVFHMEISDTLPSKLHADGRRLREILTNLLGNAIKYTERGTITLRAWSESSGNDSINLHIEVEDTGSGIKEEDIDTIFDTFIQVDKKIHQSVEGSGLGLAITKGYVNLMKGQIRVESTYGKGTCFYVDIPLTVIDPAPAGKISLTSKKQVKNIARPQYPQLRILVVDDSKINLKVIFNTLKAYGITSECVLSGAESIECCSKNEYDLIFMDQMMPEMDGEEAMKGIRELGGRYGKGGSCRIIAFTANAVKGVCEELTEKGFDGYLSKPVDLSQLEKLLSDASS